MSCTTPSVTKIDAGEPIRRHVGEAVRQGGEEARAIVAIAVIGLDEARIHIGERAEAALQLGPDLIGHGRAVAERLRGRAVDDHRHDVLHLLPVLLHQRRVGERQKNEPESDGAQDRDGSARDQGKDGQQRDDRAEGPEGVSRE